MRVWESLTAKLTQNEYQLATRCLQVGIALQCIGYASQMLRQQLGVNTAVLLTWGVSPLLANIIPLGLGLLFLLLAILTIWRPKPRVLWAVFTLVLALTALKVAAMGYLFGLSPLAHAARYLAPVALILLLKQSHNKPERSVIALRLLCLGIACTFFAHGTKALFHSESFLHLINSTTINLLGSTFSQTTLFFILDIVGLFDIAAAVLVLMAKWRPVVLYMAFWTFVAAFSRVTANGLAAWAEIALRGTYYFVPLAIFFLWQWQSKHQRVRNMQQESVSGPVGIIHNR